MAPKKEHDDWLHEVIGIPRERFSTPEATGTPLPKAPTKAEKVKATIDQALKLIQLADNSYRETKAGVSQSSFATGLTDPGARIAELDKFVHKAVDEANALLKRNDAAGATKPAEAAQTVAGQAHKLATDYAVALDHAAATQHTQITSTPWGTLTVVLERSPEFDTFIVPLTKAYEIDKSTLSEFNALSAEQKKAVVPLIPYLTAPASAAAEIETCASELAVQWATDSSMTSLLSKFVSHYKKTLQIILDQAHVQLNAAQQQLQSMDLKDQAAEKREAAERASKIIDTVVDVIVGSIKLLVAAPEEIAAEAVGVAADIVGGMIKTFKGSNLLDQAKQLEAQAKILENGAFTAEVDGAVKEIAALDGQLTELSPLAGATGAEAERTVIRAAGQYDVDCEKGRHAKDFKFRFHLVTAAQTATRRAADVAEMRWRTWMGMEANRSLLVQVIDKYGYWFGDNRKTIDTAQAEIQKQSDSCQALLNEVKEVGDRLDLLFGSALETLNKSKMPQPTH